MRSCSEHAGIKERYGFSNNAANEMKRFRLSTNNNKKKTSKEENEKIVISRTKMFSIKVTILFT